LSRFRVGGPGGTIFYESCHLDCAEGPLGRIGSVGADGRPEFRKLADIGFVDANGTPYVACA
jgi:hypothetical protein